MNPGARIATEGFEAALRDPHPDRFVLRLYIAGAAANSARAVARTREICERHLEGRYELEVVDVHQLPSRAEGDRILALPTLLKVLPAPMRRIVGDLSDEGTVLMALGLEPKS